MISSFYAALLALWVVWLSLQVIKLRRAKKVVLGDGGEPELQTAIRAQGNATEYIPISLILLILLELNDAHPALLHLGGISILIGRLIHAKALIAEDLRYRVLGMKITIFTIIGLACLNFVYGLYANLSSS